MKNQDLRPWQTVVPDGWGIDIDAIRTEEDLISLGTAMLSRMKAYWRRQAKTESAHIQTLTEKIERLDDTSDTESSMIMELQREKKTSLQKKKQYMAQVYYLAPLIKKHKPTRS